MSGGHTDDIYRSPCLGLLLGTQKSRQACKEAVTHADKPSREFEYESVAPPFGKTKI